MIEEFRSIELRELSDDELYHHGILGMSWGKRNGPPYPLTGADKKFAKAEAKRKKEKERQLEKMQAGLKKARKAKRRADKKMRKQLMKEEKKLKKKQQLLERDNYKEIMKNSKLFTTQELREIQNRHEQMRIEKLDRFLTKATKITTAVNTIANVANGFDQIRKLNRSIKMDDIDLATKELELKSKTEEMSRKASDYSRSVTEKKWKLQQEQGKARQELAKGKQELFKAYQQQSKALKDESAVAAAQIKGALDSYNQQKNYAGAVNKDAFDRVKGYTTVDKDNKLISTLYTVVDPKAPITSIRYQYGLDKLVTDINPGFVSGLYIDKNVSNPQSRVGRTAANDYVYNFTSGTALGKAMEKAKLTPVSDIPVYKTGSWYNYKMSKV